MAIRLSFFLSVFHSISSSLRGCQEALVGKIKEFLHQLSITLHLLHQIKSLQTQHIRSAKRDRERERERKREREKEGERGESEGRIWGERVIDPECEIEIGGQKEEM